jgi:hypothetical protein
MRVFLCGLLCGVGLWAQTASVYYSSPTSTVIQVTGLTGTCGVTLSQHSDLSSPITAVHPNDYSWGDGTLNIILDELIPSQTYYAAATGCPSTSNTVSWTTATIPNGVTQSPYPGFDANKWGNWPLCGSSSFDWRNLSNPCGDSLTGAKLIGLPTSYYTARTGGQAGGSNNFAHWLGGTGWTTPGNIISGGQATVGNTNPLDLFANTASETGNPVIPYDVYWALHDIGVVPVCGGSSATAADRQLNLQIYVHGSAVGNAITITCPQGSPAAVTSGSSDPDGAWPAAFPSLPFYGWSGSGVNPIIKMEDQITTGTATVSGSTATLASVSKTQHFSSALTSNDYVYLAGSSCTNEMCQISTSTSADTITLSSAPGDGSKAFQAYGWKLRVTKANATGTVTFSLKYKLAGGTSFGIQPGGDVCSPNAVTTGDGKTGYPCQFTSLVAGITAQAFVGNDGTVRLYSAISGVGFDTTDGHVMYVSGTNGGGGYTIYKKEYTGDYTYDFTYAYGCNFGFSGCPTPTEYMTTTDLMSSDLNTQIAASFSGQYSQSIYGAWTVAGGGASWLGTSGDYGFFYKFYGGAGQDYGSAWLAAVYLPTGTVTNLCHILDGSGCPGMKYNSLHSAQSQRGIINTLFVAGNALVANNSSIMHGGPFRGGIDRVWRSGAWSTDTSLPWTPDGSYDGTCPTNSYGYTTCVTFRMDLGFCNIAPSAAEIANFSACPWNGSYTQPVTWEVGDHFYDKDGAGGYDSEHFRILSIVSEGGGKYKVVAGRNAIYDYCSYTPWHGTTNTTSAQAANQLQHSNGWTPQAAPGLEGCGNMAALWNPDTADIAQLGRSMALHFEIGKNSSNTINFITQPNTLYGKTLANIGDIPPPYVATNVSFSGVGASIGSQLQSYTDQSAWAQTTNYDRAIDTNPIVACVFEALGCGAIRSLTNVSGNVYTIGVIGTGTATLAGYKTSPLFGWAGRYTLKDISGPGSDITATAYAMCLAGAANECYTGSSAGTVYVNVPQAYNPSCGASCNYMSASIDWANIPGVMMGDHAPAASIREFGISTADATGTYSRPLGYGFTSPGRQQPYMHAVMLPTGNAIMTMGSSIVDGLLTEGFILTRPSQDTQARTSDFQDVSITVPSGSAYAEVRAGYNPSLQCTARNEACSSQGDPFAFVSESRTLTSCTSGCTITFSALRNKLLYYRVYRGSNSNGSDAAASGDLLTWGIQEGGASGGSGARHIGPGIKIPPGERF